MTKKTKIISITAAAVAATAVAVGAGVTLALSTSDVRTPGGISTGGFELSAAAKNVSVYSAVGATESDYAFRDENGRYYKYQQSVMQGDEVGKIGFGTHTGDVLFSDKSVSINNILPGDKVEFDIEVTSTSTVSFYYRAELSVDSSGGQALLNQLDFSAGNLGVLRRDTTAQTPDADGGALDALYTDYTEWDVKSGNQTNVETVHIIISLPITADKGQGQSVNFLYTARGVQNATVSQGDVVSVQTPTGTQGFKSVAEGVRYAEGNGITDIKVIGDTVLEEGEIKINYVKRFIGEKNEEGNYPVLKGARFIIENSAAATFENVNFSGESYIDVSRANALTLSGCKADLTPVKFFDGERREFLADEAFIVSGSTLTPVRLTMSDCTVVSGKGAAVNLRSLLYTGTELSGNTFGGESRPYDGAAVVMFNGASGSGVISLKGNELYGSTAFLLRGSGATPYLVVSENNTAYGVKNGIFVDGNAGAAFADYGSKIGDKYLGCLNVAEGGLAFGGTDVKLNSINRITSGNIFVSESLSMAEFYTRYTEGATLAHNAILIYKDGVHYKYLNSANNDLGFVLDDVDSDTNP